MTHPSLQMLVERLLLSFLVSRDWYTYIFPSFQEQLSPKFDPSWVLFPKPFFAVFCAPYCQTAIDGPRVPQTLHCEFKLGKDICDYTLHTFITCLLTLFFLRIFHTRVFTHVICSIDLFSVQGATLSQKKKNLMV